MAPQVIDRNDQVEPQSDEQRAPRIYLSHFPSASLLVRCEDKTSPILLVLDDPVDSVRYLQQMSQCRVIEALRLQTAATSCYAQLRGRVRLLILHRLADLPTKDILDLILKHLELEVPADQYDALCERRLGSRGQDAYLESSLKDCVASYERLEEGSARFTAQETAMISDVLGPLIQMSFLDFARPVIWPTQAFLSGDRPDTPASLVADLTGGARILYYGPYFYLPAGFWTARMIVGFSAGARRTPFSVEVYGGRLLAHATMVPEAKGVFHASFGFVHDDALQPVEVRVRTDRGAIEGRLALGNIEFIRAGKPPVDATRKLESAR